jgi:peptide/nickel transport system substrate-binding protein
MRTTDFDARKEVFHAIHARMAEQIPIYGLYYEPVVDAVGPKLRDYAAWSGDKPRLWGVWKDE